MTKQRIVGHMIAFLFGFLVSGMVFGILKPQPQLPQAYVTAWNSKGQKLFIVMVDEWHSLPGIGPLFGQIDRMGITYHPRPDSK